MRFKCTFTGIDEWTDRDDLKSLSNKYKFIEWGVLFSFNRKGTENRYPSAEIIKEFRHWSDHYYWKTALHLCGSAAKTFLSPYPFASVDMKDWKDLTDKFDRIQINVNANHNFFSLESYKGRAPLIFQYNENNKQFIENINAFGVHILKDASGGNGIIGTDYSIPSSCKQRPIGFAGGLGPHNIEELFPKIYNSVISANVEGDCDNQLFWIDMESGVRTDDKLDLNKCEIVTNYVDKFIKSQPTTLEY